MSSSAPRTQHLSHFFEEVPRAHGALQPLGLACQGQFETRLGAFSTRTELARKRATAAAEGMVILRALVNARVRTQSDEAAWTILSQSLVRTLDNDIRVCPDPLVRPFINKLYETMRRTLEAILCTHLDARAMSQVTFPEHLGGRSFLRDPTLPLLTSRDNCRWHSATHTTTPWMQPKPRAPARDCAIEVERDQPTFTPAARSSFADGPGANSVFAFSGCASPVSSSEGGDARWNGCKTRWKNNLRCGRLVCHMCPRGSRQKAPDDNAVCRRTRHGRDPSGRLCLRVRLGVVYPVKSGMRAAQRQG